VSPKVLVVVVSHLVVSSMLSVTTSRHTSSPHVSDVCESRGEGSSASHSISHHSVVSNNMREIRQPTELLSVSLSNHTELHSTKTYLKLKRNSETKNKFV